MFTCVMLVHSVCLLVYQSPLCLLVFFFFNETATTAIYTYGHTLSLHDALPIWMNFMPSNRRRARATPASITASPSSPPIASTAIRELVDTRAGLLSGVVGPLSLRPRRSRGRYNGRRQRTDCAGA